MRVLPVVPRAAAVVACVLVTLSACKKPEGSQPELTSAKQTVPIRVQTVVVGIEPMPELLTVTGTLRASQESDVAANASGKVTATFVERGQKVKAGDTLAILDAKGAQLTASAAAAQTGLANAQFEQAKKECDRVKSLFQNGAISQAEYDRTTTQCQSTQWSAAAAVAQQQSAQKVVGDAVIRAPFAGVVGERSVSVGQYVQANTKVVSLFNADPLRLELTIPEVNIASVKPDMPVEFTVASFGDSAFHGAVKFISPNVRPTTRDLVIEAVCPNPDSKLMPGMFAVAQLAVGSRPMTTVPESAIKKDETASRVFAVIEDRVQERIVQTGATRNGKVAIVSGIKQGEHIVATPGADVHDGVRVE